MLPYVAKKLLSLCPVALGVLLIVCFLIHLVPGDPADIMLGDYATQTEKQEFRAKLGLDRPLPEQFGSYVAQVFSENLGTSLIYNPPVGKLIAERMTATA